MSKGLEELPQDYKFVYEIKGCQHKVDFDTNTIVDKILSTRTKKVDEEVIKQLRNFGEEKGINELILIDESKVLKIIKSLKALEIIKNKEINVHALFLHLKRFDKPDGYNVIVGTKYQITQEEYDILKEVLDL